MPEATDPAARPTYSLTDRVARAGAAEAEKTADETYVVNLDCGRSFTLGDVGGFIWASLDGQRELGEVAEAVAGRYEVSVDEAGRDLLEFAAMLAALGLVEIAKPE